MDSGGVAPQLSEEATHHLQQGIVMLLSQWSALQMAVQNEWGGRQSSQLADQLALDIFSWFTHSREPLYIDDLENILDEAMLSLNTMTEDGSIEEQVAEKLMTMHEECLERNYQSIEKLREAGSRPAVHHIRQLQKLMGSTPVDLARSNLAKSGQISRNALCPCGSKKRYKRCCRKD